MDLTRVMKAMPTLQSTRLLLRPLALSDALDIQLLDVALIAVE